MYKFVKIKHIYYLIKLSSIYNDDMYYYDFLIEMGLEIFAANLDNYNFDYDLEVKSDNLLKVAKESQ